MNTNVLWSLVDILRGSLKIQDAIVVALQVIAWIDISSKYSDLPVTYNPESRPQHGEDLGNVFTALSKAMSLGQNAAAFGYTESVVRQIDQVSLAMLIDSAERLVRNGSIGQHIVSEIVELISQQDGAVILPIEVTDLMVALANIQVMEPPETVYVPFNEGFPFGWAADRSGADAWLEIMRPSPIPWILNLLFQAKIHIAVSDPLRSPAFITKGRLTVFDKAIAFPPLNWKVDLKTQTRSEPSAGQKFSTSPSASLDVFNRFPEVTNSGNILSVRHLMAQTKGRAVIAVANGLLFSPGAEHSLRKDLIDRGIVSTIIAMPPALMKKTTIPFSILVLDMEKRSEGVLFIDASVSEFYIKDGKGRAELRWWQDILELATSTRESNYKVYVTNTAVRENDYQLQPSRYCLPAEQQRLENFLQTRSLDHIGGYVDFHRPPNSSSAESAIDVIEVSVSDFPDFGYIQTPKKSVKIDQKITKKSDDRFLRPHDILIVVKGSVGKIAIIPHSVPPPGPGGWVAGQSCLVLRNESVGTIKLKNEAPSLTFSSQVLYMYLRSDIGQMLIKRIETGTTVKLVSMRELQILPILNFTDQEKSLAENAFLDQVELQESIDAARKRQIFLSSKLWPLNF